MRIKRMPALAGILILIHSLGISSSLGDVEKLLECREEPRAQHSVVKYVVTREGPKYFIAASKGGTEIARCTLSPNGSLGAVNGYGGTYLYFNNLGRSGYLLIYSHRGRGQGGVESYSSLIDINLFQPAMSGLNTDGPRTDFTCLP